MEFLDSNKTACSGFHSHEHAYPDGFPYIESTKVLLKAISKANLQDNVSVHILEKFFEELENLSMEATQSIMKNPANNPVLEAARLCFQALSKTDIEDEVRFLVLGMLLEELGGSSMDKKQKEEEGNVMTKALCKTHFTKRILPHTEEEERDGLNHEELQVNHHVPKVETKKKMELQVLLQLLLKALFNGEMVTKEKDNALCGVHGAGTVERETKGASTAEREAKGACLRAMCSSGTGMERMEERKLSENVEPTGNNKGGSYPADNTKVAVNKGATVPRPEEGKSFLQKLMTKSGKGTIHVAQDPHPYSLADFSKYGHACMRKGKEKESPPDINSFCANNNAEDSSTLTCPCKECSTLLMHQKGTLCSSSQAEDSTFVKLAAKRGNGSHHVEQGHPPCSFAEIVRHGQKIISPQVDKEDTSNIYASTHVLSHEDSSLFKVDQEVLEKRMEACKFSVVGRIVLTKGQTPWSQKMLKERLQEVWDIKSAWKCISLGKGYYHILLSSQDEWERVWSRGPIFLKPGVMRLQRWTIDFEPSKAKSTNAQIWCRIFHLPWGLWEPSVIAGIARTVGVPIRFDKITFEGEFGHFARVLVDVDLSKSMKSNVHIECGQHKLEVKIVPESLPSFCHGCSSIGHNTNECKFICKREDSSLPTKGNSGGERDLKIDDSIGVSFDSYTGPSTSQVRKDSAKTRKGDQKSEWMKKKIKTRDNGDKSTVESSDRGFKASNIVEMITDFGAQSVTQTAKRNCSSFVHNQFSVLEAFGGLEDVFTSDSPKEGNKGKDDSMVEEVVDKSEEGIKEDPISHSSDYDESLLPTIPKRWSDILDDEEEIENAPMFLEMEIPASRDKNNKDQISNQFSVLCQEDEMTGIVPETDVSLQKIRSWVDGQYHHIRDQIQSAKQKDHLYESSELVCDVNDQSLLPKIPARWSDILDVDGDNEDAPLFLDMDFPAPSCKSKQYHPYSPQESTKDFQKMSSQELQGNPIIGGTIITPISSKKSKKVKVGFRQPVGPICSSKR